MGDAGMQRDLTPNPFPRREEESARNLLVQIPRSSGLAALYIYRVAISPVLHALFGPACRFEPSCSRFASDAIREHGVIQGGAMALRRLARCHPLGGHGYDPVPAKRP